MIEIYDSYSGQNARLREAVQIDLEQVETLCVLYIHGRRALRLWRFYASVVPGSIVLVISFLLTGLRS
jgi:hypothetical protein